MHSLRGKRGRIATLLFALAAVTTLPSPAAAGPAPGARPGSRFRLFAGSLGAMTINRVAYGLSTGGLVGVDSTNSSTIGGGFWPRGTANQYMFNSGLQVSGIIKGAKPTNPWGGDTTGAFFFDPKGTTEHGIGLTDLFNATSAVDVASWPAYGFVPQGDTSEALFDPLLRNRLSASQGDVWFLTWEGDPGLNAGRPHPLGIVAEYRGLGWNYPAGNEDILYFIITFYNVTSVNPADYAAIRPGLREKLLVAGQDFQRLNNAKFKISLPTGGYTINPFYAAFAADADVADAGSNFASVNLPFAMGYAYDATFSQPPGWRFEPAIFSKPFFAGAGFVGMKYLKSPGGPGAIQLFSLTTNGGAFPDPANTTRLFRYMSGDVGPDLGVSCNQGLVAVSHICFILADPPADIRIIQSASPDSLKPGESKSIVIAYIHAAPVALVGYQIGGVKVQPGDPTRLSNAALLAGQGANRIDSLTGFNGYTDANNDGIVQQGEMKTVKGSLLDKGLTAQAVFDAKFLLPFAPDSPDFFLIPGNQQITVLWKPSKSEVDGDAFFQIAKNATVTPPGGGAPVPNVLYDPNYRKFDVEGYRIYRGRIDSPGTLKLVAQYDYAGTSFVDFGGQVPLGSACAPEISVTTSCSGVFDPIAAGVTRTKSVPYDITGELVQIKFGNRAQLASGDIINLSVDTAVTGGASGFPTLSNTGVPFVFTDRDVRNGLTYYYAVTAFDYNSIQSGPTSLESPRTTKRIVPNSQAGNYDASVTLTPKIVGRGSDQSAKFPTAPTLDATTGIFSGPQQPANAGFLGFVGVLPKEVVKTGGSLRVKLLSIDMGQMDLSGCCGGGREAIPVVYHFSLTANGQTINLTIPLTVALDREVSSSQFFDALTLDPVLAAKFGATSPYIAKGSLTVTAPSGTRTSSWGLGFALGEPGLSAGDLPPGTTNYRYNGARWFDGPSPAKNETQANPINSCGSGFSACSSTTSFANAGKLTGVVTVYQPISYTMFNREWRNMESPLSTVRRAADYNIYWGAAGKVDSIIDVTHNVVVPFEATKVSGGWGILNQAATTAAGFHDNRPGVLTPTDWTCVEPFRSVLSQPTQSFFPCAAPAVPLSNTAVLGPIAFGAGNNQSLTAAQSIKNPNNTQPNPGFSMIVAGVVTMFEMTALPATGTVWALRDYAGGIIAGGTGTGGSGNAGPYRFVPGIRPFTAIGAEGVVAYDVKNSVVASTPASLAKVHTVPDPYYVTSAFEATTTTKIIRFVNLPEQATIRIYTSSGVLVRILKQASGIFGGELTWDVRNRNNQFVASGVYFYHVTAENGETTVGRMTIVNYAQ